MKLTVAGKGGVGKTTVSAIIVRELASHGQRVLAVDCDPNPTLAEELGLRSDELDRFTGSDGLEPEGDTLGLKREPCLVEVAPRIMLLGGPPSPTPLADAVARGIAGVLLADRFDVVVTDLGAGPELAGIAVGGILNPADLCLVLDDGTPGARRAAERIAAAAAARSVPVIRVMNHRGQPQATARHALGLIRAGGLHMAE